MQISDEMEWVKESSKEFPDYQLEALWRHSAFPLRIGSLIIVIPTCRPYL